MKKINYFYLPYTEKRMLGQKVVRFDPIDDDDFIRFGQKQSMWDKLTGIILQDQKQLEKHLKKFRDQDLQDQF